MDPTFEGMAFPLAIDPALGELARERAYDRYLDSLVRQVILTSHGERICRPTLGAGVRRLLFAPASAAVTAPLAESTIRQALDRWLGRLLRTESIAVSVEVEVVRVAVAYLVLARGERRFLNLEIALRWPSTV
jgi:phage baseplate assembly protein W